MAARNSPTNPRPEINTRQELFCRKVAEGVTQYESYIEARYKAATRVVADSKAMVNNGLGQARRTGGKNLRAPSGEGLRPPP